MSVKSVENQKIRTEVCKNCKWFAPRDITGLAETAGGWCHGAPPANEISKRWGWVAENDYCSVFTPATAPSRTPAAPAPAPLPRLSNEAGSRFIKQHAERLVAILLDDEGEKCTQIQMVREVTDMLTGALKKTTHGGWARPELTRIIREFVQTVMEEARLTGLTDAEMSALRNRIKSHFREKDQAKKFAMAQMIKVAGPPGVKVEAPITHNVRCKGCGIRREFACPSSDIKPVSHSETKFRTLFLYCPQCEAITIYEHGDPIY